MRVNNNLIHEICKGGTPPLLLCPAPAGFPSPADDYVEKSLDLNEHLIRNHAATFFIRVSGDSMIEAGIHDQDILVVDRSVRPAHGEIVVAVLDGELTVKHLQKKDGLIVLVPANVNYKEIPILPEQDFHVWGTVVGVVRKYR